MNKIDLKAWENRSQTQQGGVSLQMAQMAEATFNHEPRALRSGDAMPPLWHWFGFAPMMATNKLGRDGHPPLGDFMPPVPLERRMWAGGRLDFVRPIHVDEVLERHTSIRSVT